MTTEVLQAHLTGLSGTLHEQFTNWLDRRKPQEEKMLRCYQDMMRIPRDDDTKDVGTSKAQKSKIFIGSTRSKIRSARAKIKDSLFGNGELPFDTKPTNEKLKDFSDTMEEILSVQLEEGKFKQTLGTGVDSIATYGTGFIFGPFVKKMNHTSVESVDAGGYQKLQENKLEYDCPYYEHARTMDCYPDPEAEDVREGNGIYWASRKQPEFIRQLKGEEGYNDEAIERALTEKVSSYTDQGSDRTDQARQNLYRYTREGRIWFVRFFGLVKKSQLRDWKRETGAQPAEDDAEKRVEAIVIMAGGHVIKAEENPYKDQKRPVRRCVYEDVEHEMWGVGIGENNDPMQRVTNAAFRLFIEGKAYAGVPLSSIDRSKFEVTEDFKVFPGKRYFMRPGLTPEERKEAIIWHTIPDVTEGWTSVIEFAEQFSDDDTAITKYTQGNDAQHLNKTATGVSMIMNASSLPLKEVLSNIDQMWIEDMIEDLIDWDIEHLEPETVKVLLGDRQAQIWAQIKQYGKTNFMEWFATGSSTFMAKEVLMHKLQGFLQIVAGSEPLMQHIDVPELMQQVWDAGQIGKESPVLSDDDLQKKQSQGVNAQAQQHIQEIEQKATALIKQANDKAQQAQMAAQDAKRQEELKIQQLEAQIAENNRKHELALHDALNKNIEQGHKSHLTEAQIDLTQAQTLKTLAEAGKAASPELEAEGANAEGEKPEAEPAKPDPMLEKLTGMHADLLAKHGETLDALKKSAGPRKRTMTMGPNGQKVVIDQPLESGLSG